MTSHAWCWSDIVSADLVEHALKEQRRRRERRQRSVFDDWDAEPPHPSPYEKARERGGMP